MRARELAWVTAWLANQIPSRCRSLKLLLMAFVWRRGGFGVRLLASDKQKVTSLKNCIILPLDWFRGNRNNTNYVGFLPGTCLVAFKGEGRCELLHLAEVLRATSPLGRWSGDAGLIGASSCCFRLALAERNHKLSPTARLSAVN